MRRTLILFVLTLGAAPAWGQADTSREQCYGSKASADQVIAACTALIDAFDAETRVAVDGRLRLYPNPTLSVSTLSAYTQGCNIEKCGAVAPSLTQLFEVAGRRGYRMEAAALDTMSIEAKFEGLAVDMADPAVMADREKYQATTKAYSEMEPLVEASRKRRKLAAARA